MCQSWGLLRLSIKPLMATGMKVTTDLLRAGAESALWLTTALPCLRGTVFLAARCKTHPSATSWVPLWRMSWRGGAGWRDLTKPIRTQMGRTLILIQTLQKLQKQMGMIGNRYVMAKTSVSNLDHLILSKWPKNPPKVSKHQITGFFLN